MHGNEIPGGERQRVEVLDERAAGIDHDPVAVAIRHTGDADRRAPVDHALHQLENRPLALSEHRGVERRAFRQRQLGERRRMGTAEDEKGVGHPFAHSRRQCERFANLGRRRGHADQPRSGAGNPFCDGVVVELLDLGAPAAATSN
jgi:hypothetical protein